MELTYEQFEARFAQFDNRLQAVEQGQHRLEIEVAREIASVKQDIERAITGVKQAVADSQARIIQWVVSLFIGSMVTLATLGGIYISVLLAQ